MQPAISTNNSLIRHFIHSIEGSIRNLKLSWNTTQQTLGPQDQDWETLFYVTYFLYWYIPVNYYELRDYCVYVVII